MMTWGTNAKKLKYSNVKQMSKYPNIQLKNDESGKVNDSINEETENGNHNEFEGNESLNAES